MASRVGILGAVHGASAGAVVLGLAVAMGAHTTAPGIALLAWTLMGVTAGYSISGSV